MVGGLLLGSREELRALGNDGCHRAFIILQILGQGLSYKSPQVVPAEVHGSAFGHHVLPAAQKVGVYEGDIDTGVGVLKSLQDAIKVSDAIALTLVQFELEDSVKDVGERVGGSLFAKIGAVDTGDPVLVGYQVTHIAEDEGTGLVAEFCGVRELRIGIEEALNAFAGLVVGKVEEVGAVSVPAGEVPDVGGRGAEKVAA